MTTRKKLNANREAARKQRIEDERPVGDPTPRPRWKRHTKEMNSMLRGVDPDQFERLAGYGGGPK
jgi:hypothetical protein